MYNDSNARVRIIRAARSAERVPNLMIDRREFCNAVVARAYTYVRATIIKSESHRNSVGLI